ncbi:hypothetical protein L345_08342, partial [Ophiophagus hannah]
MENLFGTECPNQNANTCTRVPENRRPAGRCMRAHFLAVFGHFWDCFWLFSGHFQVVFRPFFGPFSGAFLAVFWIIFRAIFRLPGKWPVFGVIFGPFSGALAGMPKTTKAAGGSTHVTSSPSRSSRVLVAPKCHVTHPVIKALLCLQKVSVPVQDPSVVLVWCVRWTSFLTQNKISSHILTPALMGQIPHNALAGCGQNCIFLHPLKNGRYPSKLSPSTAFKSLPPDEHKTNASIRETYTLGLSLLYFSSPPRPLSIHFISTHTHPHTHPCPDMAALPRCLVCKGLTAAPAEVYLSPGTCLSQPIRRKNLTEPTSDDSLSTVLGALQPRRERKLTIFWLSRHWETWADHRRDSKLTFTTARFLATRSHRPEGEGERIRKLEIVTPSPFGLGRGTLHILANLPGVQLKFAIFHPPSRKCQLSWKEVCFSLLMFEEAAVQGNCRPFPGKRFPCGTNVSRQGLPHQMQRQSSAGRLPEVRADTPLVLTQSPHIVMPLLWGLCPDAPTVSSDLLNMQAIFFQRIDQGGTIHRDADGDNLQLVTVIFRVKLGQVRAEGLLRKQLRGSFREGFFSAEMRKNSCFCSLTNWSSNPSPCSSRKPYILSDKRLSNLFLKTSSVGASTASGGRLCFQAAFGLDAPLSLTYLARMLLSPSGAVVELQPCRLTLPTVWSSILTELRVDSAFLLWLVK